MSKKLISELLKKRNLLLRKDVIKADSIEIEILNMIKDNFDEYEVDYIFETLTHLGQAPNLVYDDNGRFAVSGIGYQPVVTGNEKIEGIISVFVSKNDWRKSIYSALYRYVSNLVA